MGPYPILLFTFAWVMLKYTPMAIKAPAFRPITTMKVTGPGCIFSVNRVFNESLLIARPTVA